MKYFEIKKKSVKRKGDWGLGVFRNPYLIQDEIASSPRRLLAMTVFLRFILGVWTFYKFTSSRL